MRLWTHRGTSIFEVYLERVDVTEPTIHAEKPYSLVVRPPGGDTIAAWHLNRDDLGWLAQALTKELLG